MLHYIQMQKGRHKMSKFYTVRYYLPHWRRVRTAEFLTLNLARTFAREMCDGHEGMKAEVYEGPVPEVNQLDSFLKAYWSTSKGVKLNYAGNIRYGL